MSGIIESKRVESAALGSRVIMEELKKAPQATVLGDGYLSDDRVRLLANFLADYLSDSNVEIEAKIGFYRFRDRIPHISHITLLDQTATPFSFTSSVDENYFNSLKDTLQRRGLPMTAAKTEDLIYEANEHFAKLRKTIDPITQNVLEISYKAKLFDLNFLLNPASCLGIRISANREKIIEQIHKKSKFLMSRVKDRSSFAYEYFRIDMTKADQNRTHSNEVEIEIADVEFVRKFIDPYKSGTDRGSLFSIANKFWQNALGIAQFNAPVPVPVWSEGMEFRSFEVGRLELYREVIGDIKPVIGDYLYMVAKEEKEKINAKQG